MAFISIELFCEATFEAYTIVVDAYSLAWAFFKTDGCVNLVVVEHRAAREMCVQPFFREYGSILNCRRLTAK
jgi:hypothetical protein